MAANSDPVDDQPRGGDSDVITSPSISDWRAAGETLGNLLADYEKVRDRDEPQPDESSKDRSRT
jgi:hypothetical protein